MTATGRRILQFRRLLSLSLYKFWLCVSVVLLKGGKRLQCHVPRDEIVPLVLLNFSMVQQKLRIAYLLNAQHASRRVLSLLVIEERTR